MASSTTVAVSGMGALPVVLDVVVGALDAWLLYWIYKTGRVLLEPPKMKLLPDEFGVLDQLVPINPLSDPINALSNPLKEVSSLLFGWSSPFGVIRLHETYESVRVKCMESFASGTPMPTFQTGPYTLKPNAMNIGFVQIVGWYITRNEPTTPGISSFSKEYVMGWDAGGCIVFDQE